ncbi:MAG: (Fe-S)-binding protein [Tepidiformaceae bacterium]
MVAVALFDPCYMAAIRPGDAGHARHVLEALGDSVTLIDGRCCGQPAFNSGFRAEARAAGRELLRAAREHGAVIVPSASCTAMATHYLPSLFEGARARTAGAIGARFSEFAAYVASHPGLEGLGLRLAGTVVYHDSCHARRELGLTATVLGLLARVEGLEVRRLPNEAECCGFGGAFSVKQPEVSVAMMTGKLDEIAASGARVVVSTDLSCLAHLESGARGIGLGFETWTVAEVLSRALA